MKLLLGGHSLRWSAGRPVVMGILNLNPDSVADSDAPRSLDAQLDRAHALWGEGAQIIELGAESGRTDREALSSSAQIGLLRPLVRLLARDGIPVAVDTWRPSVAANVLDAGACLINDVSGLRHPELAARVAEYGAGLVLVHTRAPPKVEQFPRYRNVLKDVTDFLGERVVIAEEAGVAPESILVDPGPDFAKTPAETVRVLAHLGELRALEKPILLAISRKYFIGVITGQRPDRRLAGTLGALAVCLNESPAVLRVHDVAAVHEFLAVYRTIGGHEAVPEWNPGDERLKWLQPRT